ncbi:MAG TPA: hypothetical protein VFG11_08460 [Acidobacteriota bacterium]|nr:hypothetical protein [Acidobacteriota bacterium]
MSGLLFSIVCYILGMGSLIWYFAYIQWFIDRDPAPFSWGALIFNAVLFMIFPLQHSLLARVRAKNAINRHIHPLLERPLYVGASGIAMVIVIGFWRRLGPMLYVLPYPIVFDVVTYACVVLLIVITIKLGHHQLFGLANGYAVWKQKSLPEKGQLQTDGIFGIVRHPLTSVLIAVLWTHNTMTVGRLEFNVLFTAYALAGTIFEERDLVRTFGPQYLEYRKAVPAFFPRLFR